MNSYFEILPDEIYLQIFKNLPCKDIISCLLVSNKWNDISKDKTLTIYYLKQQIESRINITKIFLNCCYKGYEDCVDIVVNLMLNKPLYKPNISYLCLWNEGFLKASEGGNVNIMEKILKYGATDVYAEKALTNIKDNKKGVNLILDNFHIHNYIVSRILTNS